MRRSFCGSHRERVEAAAALQSSRRRRRISLELEEFERPGGRALVEDSPEVEAYLAALSVAERPRRASIDCPRGAYNPSLAPPEEGVPHVPMEEDEDGPGEEEVDSKRGALKDDVSSTVERMQISRSMTQSLQGHQFRQGAHSGTCKKVLASAKKACSSFVKRVSLRASGSQGRSKTGSQGNKGPEEATSRALASPRQGAKASNPSNLSLTLPCRKIYDTWAGEGKLSEWVDWAVVDSALRPPDLMQAQAALISGSRGTGQMLAASAGDSKS